MKKTVKDIDVSGKRVIVRCDFNVFFMIKILSDVYKRQVICLFQAPIYAFGGV